jgi:dolichyl-phosphate-mannose--protein O-mannosyl transferase
MHGGEDAARPPARSRAYRWLAVLPALGMLGGVPLVNRVHLYVLGLPFLLVWILACVLLTSAVMAVIGALDRRQEAGVAPEPAPRGEPGVARPSPPGDPGPREPGAR